jgi:hypothetical protein
MIGCELWIPLAHLLDTRVYVSPSRYPIYSLLCPDVLTQDPSKARIHICDGCSLCLQDALFIKVHAVILFIMSLLHNDGDPCYLSSMHPVHPVICTTCKAIPW